MKILKVDKNVVAANIYGAKVLYRTVFTSQVKIEFTVLKLLANYHIAYRHGIKKRL